MDTVVVRPAESRDVDAVALMFHALWSDTDAAEHARDLSRLVAGRAPGKLPAAIFVAAVQNRLVGFLHTGLRSHADGCDPSRPVGYIEGWYVEPEYRLRKVGAQLIAAAEQWARRHQCTEMASDTWVDNEASQRAHEALGFEVVDRCVNYRKQL